MDSQIKLKSRPRFLSLAIFLIFTTVTFAQAPYITVWKTDNPGSNGDDQVALYAWGSYDYTWEEINNPGNSGSGSDSDEATLTFPHPGEYELKITPVGSDPFHRIKVGGQNEKLIKIVQWGDVVWSSFENAYRAAKHLKITATDLPDLSQVSSMRHAFSATGFLTITNVNSWDVSHVTTMSYMFMLSNFNRPIDNWDVSHVTDMSYMFYGAYFDQALNNWDVGQVTTMEGMFGGAFYFNQPLENWDVSHVRTMRRMFKDNYAFNQPLQQWDVSHVTDMREMFAVYPYILAVTSEASPSSHPPIKKNEVWGPYNQPLNDWDVSRVKKTDSMFNGAKKFDRSLDQWELDSLESAVDMFSDSGMGCENYSLTLRGWATNTHTPNDIDLGASTLKYSPDILDERQHLITDLNWTISGDQEGTCTLSISDYTQHPLRIYPNPARDHVTVSGLSQPGRFVLYDLNGRRAAEGEFSGKSTTIGIEGISKGIYFLHFHFTNGLQTIRKLVKR